MLNQLLALKKRREGTIRQRIAAGKRRAQQIQQQQQQLTQQRDELWKAWRLANQQQQQVPQGMLYEVQQHLAAFYRRDQAITQQQSALQQELLQIAEQQAQQTQLLQRNRIEQQKLTYVLEVLEESS